MKLLDPRLLLDNARLTRWSYLAFALSTLYVVQRARNNKIPRENILGMFASLAPSELSHKLVMLNACVAGVLLKKQTPVFSRWSGALAGLVQCVVLAKLASWFGQNLSSKGSMRAALAASGMTPQQLQQLGDMTWRRWLTVLLPLPQPMALAISFPDVSKTRTLTYAHVGRNRTTELLMDVYKHRDTPANAPIFLYIHGGGWIIGDRRLPPFACVYQVATLGWVVCVIDYRLSPKVAFPTHLIDSKRAVAYLRRHAQAELDADADFIAVGGESAGAHLASLVALTAEDKTLQPGFEDVDTSVRAVVDNYGVHDFTDRNDIYYRRDKSRGFMWYLEFLVMQRKLKHSAEAFERASPLSWLEADLAAQRQTPVPPFLITHGTHDNTSSLEDSRVFFEQLQRYREQLSPERRQHESELFGDVHDAFVEVPFATHMFNFLLSPRALAHGDAVCAFLDNVYRKTKTVPLDQRFLPLIAAPEAAEAAAPASASRL